VLVQGQGDGLAGGVALEADLRVDDLGEKAAVALGIDGYDGLARQLRLDLPSVVGKGD
jgi:hypothetical protein